MYLKIKSFYKRDNGLASAACYPNGGGYKTVEELQKTLMQRWKNKKVHTVSLIANGIKHIEHSSVVYQEVILEV